jgi:hypothetical protein
MLAIFEELALLRLHWPVKLLLTQIFGHSLANL